MSPLPLILQNMKNYLSSINNFGYLSCKHFTLNYHKNSYIFVLSFGNMNEYSKYSKPSKSEKVFIFKCICTEILNAVSLQVPDLYLIFKVSKYLSLHESFSSQKPNTNIGPESSIPWRCIVWNDERGLSSLPLWTLNWTLPHIAESDKNSGKFSDNVNKGGIISHHLVPHVLGLEETRNSCCELRPGQWTGAALIVFTQTDHVLGQKYQCFFYKLLNKNQTRNIAWAPNIICTRFSNCQYL